MRGQSAAPRGVRTVEQTAKKWKGLQLIGCFGLMASIVWAIVAGQSDSIEAIVGPLMAGVVSAAIYMYARIMAWWHHG
ncbi:MAG: hypothetical protein GX537_08755 [Actinobacteria bacterium]|nr:hypothetical protein [Actinomycetota bacterium]